MIIKPNENSWRLGELVSLSWNEELMKKSGKKSYAYYAVSRYICIREATDGQSGILVKVLGRTPREHIILVNGEPFCKDEGEDLLKGRRYFSYPFPTVNELKKVLNIVRSDMDLQQQFIDNGIFFYPEGSSWVSDTKSLFFGLKRSLQYYDPSTDRLATAKSNDEHHQRITIAYF